MRNKNVSSKKCNRCKLKKAQSEFGKNKNHKDGLRYYCKSCDKIVFSNYRKTEKGVINKIFGHQKENSKKRGHKPPNYTKQELTIWLYKNRFKELFDNWVKSGYKKDLKPSCDRLNDTKGYGFDNIQLGVWSENNLKNYKDTIKGVTKHKLRFKAVNQYSKNNVFIKDIIHKKWFY